MKKLLISALITLMSALTISPASAHQAVVLLDTDTTAEKGPLLVDGTISFAIRASFTKSGQKKAFRAALKEGDQLDVQYLIVDKKPENMLKNTLLPQLVITSPTGKKITIKFTERTKFYEPWGRTNYLYMARISTPAEAGIYSFVATSRTKSAITIAVGEKEVTGEVLRGPAPVSTPTVSAKPSPTAATSASPTPEVTTASAYTMAKVKENNSATSCWSVINGKVYDLTKWINSHPGGASAIKGLCGIDGTSSFTAQHRGQGSPASNLANYLLGPLAS
jgi:cytochrome b involved in lipid metabolism